MLPRSAALFAAVMALGCSQPPAPPLPSPEVASAAAPEPPASAPPAAAPAEPPGPAACGALGCRLFDGSAAALRAVLADKPRVLAVGEAHAQKATPGIPSSARRFTADLLPELAGKASDLVIELMAPPTGCEAKTRAVKKEMAKVTEHQAETNQNEYVTMGDEAKKLGIAPHLLHPSCADFKAISAPGANPVDVSLTLIGRLMRESAEKLLARNAKEGVDKIVVLYGGALHNDVAPAEVTRDWCFGPQLIAKTSGRYVELDVFVPEFVAESGLWKKFAWYPHFDKKAHPDKATMFAPAPASYTLLLPATRG